MSAPPLTLAAAEDLFERRRRAWLDEDLEGYLALWAEDMTFGSPVHPEPLRGRAAFAALIRGSAASVQPRRFDFHHLAVRDDWVLAEWTVEIESRADGRLRRYRGMSVARIREGLIVEWREYWNPGDLK